MRIADGPPAPGVAETPLAPAPSPRAALRTAYVIAATVAMLAALLAGFALRSAVTTDEPAQPPTPRNVDIGPLRLAVGGAWTPEAVARTGIRGLDERATAAFAPAPGLRAHALLTVAPIDDPTLVPAPVRALLSKPLTSAKRTTLLGAPAWRYAAQGLSGDRVMEVTVAATSAGALAVVCLARSAAWVAASGCAEGVKAISIEDARWLEPAPDLALRARAPRVLERLDRSRVAMRANLRAAGTRRAQSRIAGRLARAYDRAGASLAPLAPDGGAARDLVTSLEHASGAHRALATASANAWPKRYRQARRKIARRDADLRRTLSALR